MEHVSDAAVETRDLTRSFGEIQAVRRLTFSVRPGELFGFIGPDGAGKTTAMRMLVTVLKPDHGTARVLGCDVVREYRTLRRLVGYMPGRFSLYQDLSVEENLRFYATVFGTTPEENYDLIRDIYVQLEPFKTRRAGKLSGGMKQKLALSCALIHKPQILFLDEPTTGVDAVSRVEFWEMLGKLKDQGITTLVSTPYMDEATRCDRVALMQDGVILNIDTPGNIVDAFPYPLLAVRTPNKFATIAALREYRFARSVFAFGEHIHYTDRREQFESDEIADYLRQRGLAPDACRFVKAGIEDSFMALMELKSHE